MTNKSIRRVWFFGLSPAFLVALASCSGPVPAGANAGGGKSGSGSGSSHGAQTTTSINLNPGGTSSKVSTGTEITDDQNCGVKSNDATKQRADLLLILDRSGSMGYGMDTDGKCQSSRRGGGSTTCVARWPTMKTALSQVLTNSTDSVNWGLELFSTPNRGNCTVSSVQVPVAAGNAAAINGEIEATSPGGNTPTREAVKQGTAYLKTVTGPETKSILLATDGQPNCSDSFSSSEDDVAATTAAIKDAFNAGFKVYVLGIGPETSTDALNGFADAGGTTVKDASGPGKNYYAALSAEDLAKQLGSIVGSVASCTFALTNTPPVPDNVAVEFDGNRSLRAPHDRTNGWDYPTPGNYRTIQLYGSWCDGLMNGTYKTAKVLFGCPGQIIP